VFNHSIFFDFGLIALTRVDQDLAATKTFYLLAKYDSVKSDALQLSAEDVETGANVQLPTSACLYVEQQTLSPTFVLEQLMFWFHQPQRKIDVLTLSGAGELPCPTNVLRCCMGAGLSAEEHQRHQDLLAGFTPPPSCRRIRLHQFATCLSKAFIGCAALCHSMKELQDAASFKGPNLLLCPNQATSVSERAGAIVCSTVCDSHQIPARKTWHDAEQILEQKEEEIFKKRKRSVKVLYLVRWRGEPRTTSWEPKCNINAELFAEWTNSHRDSPAFRTASPIPLSSDDAPAAPVSMFPYRSQEVGHCIDAMLTARVHGHIYGVDIYTDDSDVATAALHAGFLQPGETKLVKVYVTGPCRKFLKCLRNGIQSHRFSHFPGSFTFDARIAEDMKARALKAKKGAGRGKKARVLQSEQGPDAATDDEVVFVST
jgi:hypothetical protein